MGNWEENVRRVEPYVPGEQPKIDNLIKINTNENPYPPSPRVAEVLKSFDADTLRLYPDPKVDDLVGCIARHYGVEKENVFVGVGSDDVIAMSFLTFFNSKKPVLFPDITYSFYDVWANMLRIPYTQIPLNDAFEIVGSDYDRECGGIILPNPNAPTGIAKPLSEIEAIVASHPDVVVMIDEAYVDFGAESALPLIEKYENVLVIQTFSKSRSMAGARVGYAFGSKKLISYLNDVKYSFNSYTMDRVTIQTAVAAMEDEEYFRETVRKIIDTREWTKQELRALGFTFGDSKANFIFAHHPNVDATTLFGALRQEGIIVRHFSSPRIVDHLRITIGTREEMECVIRFLKKYLQNSGE
jgi:histidinol-phosphate aminotransferase